MSRVGEFTVRFIADSEEDAEALVRESQRWLDAQDGVSATVANAWHDEPPSICGACGMLLDESPPHVCDLDPDRERDERRLKDALIALNRADRVKDGPLEPRDRALRRIRDEVWALGRDLYRWDDGWNS